MNKHQATKPYKGNGGVAPRILELGSRWVVSFTTWPPYLQG